MCLQYVSIVHTTRVKKRYVVVFRLDSFNVNDSWITHTYKYIYYVCVYRNHF
jgi:hypothetical protein